MIVYINFISVSSSTEKANYLHTSAHFGTDGLMTETLNLITVHNTIRFLIKIKVLHNSGNGLMKETSQKKPKKSSAHNE